MKKFSDIDKWDQIRVVWIVNFEIQLFTNHNATWVKFFFLQIVQHIILNFFVFTLLDLLYIWSSSYSSLNENAHKFQSMEAHSSSPKHHFWPCPIVLLARSIPPDRWQEERCPLHCCVPQIDRAVVAASSRESKDYSSLHSTATWSLATSASCAIAKWQAVGV